MSSLSSQLSQLKQELNSKTRSKPYLIGISGGSGGGKTSVANLIHKSLGRDYSLLFSMDTYYKDLTPEQEKDLSNYNFDSPEALDLDLLYQHLNDLMQWKKIQMPTYDFATNKRQEKTIELTPAKVIIFEGILAFYDKRMRDLMDIKLFFDLDSDIRFARRIMRDISDRSRQINTVVERYFRFVKPAFDRYILPTKKFADFVIPQDNLSSLPVEIVSQNIIVNVLHSRREVFEKVRRRESIHIIEEDFLSRKYFYDPKLKELSVVSSEKDIKKFNKIIHYIIKKMKSSYYGVYCGSIVGYLFDEHKKINKDKIRSILIEIQNQKEIQKFKETITKEEKCILCIFEPNLIQKNTEFENSLINLFNEFKEYNVQYELLAVYMTNQTFNGINKVVTDAAVKMNYITVYFGDNLFYDEQNIISGGKINTNVIDLGDVYLTRANFISKFHFEKNKYLN